jgi:hypothetical protein
LQEEVRKHMSTTFVKFEGFEQSKRYQTLGSTRRTIKVESTRKGLASFVDLDNSLETHIKNHINLSGAMTAD